MNQIKKIKSLKLDAWFLDQIEKPDSMPAGFYWNFLLNFVLKNLDDDSKEKFLRLLANNKTDQIMPYIIKNIPDFEKRFSQELGKKLFEMKKSMISNQ